MSTYTQLEKLLGPLKASVPTILDEDESSTFPSEAELLLKEFRVLDYLIPHAQGGKMESLETVLAVGRSISRRNLSAAIAIGQTLLGSLPIWLAGSGDQKSELVAQLKKGKLGCLALTEEEHGSDLSSTEVSNTTEGELTGKKWCINNATRGEMMSVLSKNVQTGLVNIIFIQKNKPHRGKFANTPKLRTHGIRGADISGIVFENFQQTGSLVGKEGQGLEIVFKTLQISRLLCAAFTLGAVDTVLRRTLEFSEARILYGKSILEIPAIRSKLTEAYKKVLLIESFTLVAGRLVTFLPEQMSVYSAVSKYYVSELGDEVIKSCSEVMGARYYIRENQFGIIQKMERDHRVVSLFDGSSAVNLNVIAGQLKRLAMQEQQEAPELDPALVFDLLRAAPYFSGDEKLKLTNRGNDYIWKCVHQNLNSGTDEFDRLLSELKIQKSELNAEIQNVPTEEVSGPQMTDLARRYCALTLKANYLLFWLFNQKSFELSGLKKEDNLSSVLGSKELDLLLPLQQMQEKKLFSHFSQVIND